MPYYGISLVTCFVSGLTPTAHVRVHKGHPDFLATQRRCSNMRRKSCRVRQKGEHGQSRSSEIIIGVSRQLLGEKVLRHGGVAQLIRQALRRPHRSNRPIQTVRSLILPSYERDMNQPHRTFCSRMQICTPRSRHTMCVSKMSVIRMSESFSCRMLQVTLSSNDAAH